ncbi:MAG: metallophosphoesterase, partial [Planctomycetota bacterium]
MSLSYGLIESIDLTHPRLPAELEGLRIAHFSDPHLPVAARHTARALRQLARVRVDLIALTGDYMDRHRPPDAAREMLEQLAADFRPRLGIVGVFGNHDRPPLMDDPPAADTIRWLSETAYDVPGLPLRLAGLGERGYDPPDPAKLALQLGKAKLAPEHDKPSPPAPTPQSPNHPTAKPPDQPFSLFLLH